MEILPNYPTSTSWSAVMLVTDVNGGIMVVFVFVVGDMVMLVTGNEVIFYQV
jgi:hypothetical protein